MRPNQVKRASKKKPNGPKTADPTQNPWTKKMHQNAAEREIESGAARGHHGYPVVAAMAVAAGVFPGTSFPLQPFVFPRDFSLVCVAVLPLKEDELGCKRG